jgi:putative PD-(D/E)XK family protein DUF4420
MSEAAPDDRHLTRDGLGYYLASGAPAIVKIEGDPIVYLSIEPSCHRLALRAPLLKGGLPDLSGYQNLSAAVVHWNDRQWCEFRVEGAMLLDAYPLLCLVADRIQLEACDFAPSVLASLASFRRLLAGYSRMSEQEQVGLYGELLLLKHLLSRLPPEEAVAAWRGPDSEEHDFDIGDDDVEVKTTISEDRRHWINDAHQLAPSLGRRLWVVSIQLTGAGLGGVSLSDIVSELQSLLPEASVVEFRRKLSSLNWREETAWLYPHKLRLRSKPEVYEVDQDFPALTTQRLSDAGVDHRRFVQIRYLVDLSGVAAADKPPGLLEDICGGQNNA